MQNYKPVKNLLSKGSTNAKTSKNPETTYILYLAPYTQNSKKINICPKASAGCSASCLIFGRSRIFLKCYCFSCKQNGILFAR